MDELFHMFYELIYIMNKLLSTTSLLKLQLRKIDKNTDKMSNDKFKCKSEDTVMTNSNLYY